MSTLSISCGYLLLDASAAISLFASRRMDDILASLPCKASVIDIIRNHEIRYIWGGSEPNVRECKESIDLQPLIDENVLTEVTLSDSEYVTMVNIAAQSLGNGESAATAVALHRGWGVCTDDYRGLPRLRRLATNVPFVVTTQLVHHWAMMANPTEAEVRTALHSMQLRAGFGCATQEPLSGWLQQYLDRG